MRHTMPNTPFDPQFEREVLPLIGTWEIEITAPTGNFSGTIQVPFCIESARGLGYRGVITRCVYRKKVGFFSASAPSTARRACM